MTHGPRIAILTAALLASGTAQAGPMEWLPATPECEVTGEALELRIEEATHSCREVSSQANRRERQAVHTQCMQDAGWSAVEKGKTDHYERFCALAGRLQSSPDDDPVAVATIPQPSHP